MNEFIYPCRDRDSRPAIHCGRRESARVLRANARRHRENDHGNLRKYSVFVNFVQWFKNIRKKDTLEKRIWGPCNKRNRGNMG